VDQLKKMMPESHIVNISKGGRTVGFDNNGNKDLNALRNMNNYLDDALKTIENQTYDFVIVGLGTNDTKYEYANRQKEVVANFDTLLLKIKEHPLCLKSKPQLIYVTPPPIRTQNIEHKYEGGNERIAQLIPQFTAIATKKGFEVVDVYHPLLGILDYYSADGVHMVGAGQEIIASRIVEAIQKIK
jgi:lysophospholipase L1-like esterase